MSNADEILKYKKLLDEQIITKEEFDKKKKELLEKNVIIDDNENIKQQDEYFKDNNCKKNIVLRVISYMLAIIFMIASLGAMATVDFGAGVLYFLIGLLILPAFNNFLWNKFNVKISIKGKIIIFIILSIICVIGESGLEGKISPNIKKDSETILDVKEFYKNNKERTITPEELVNLKGEPINIENWNYEIDKTTSYQIMTYTYESGVEYNFYNGNLYWILIEKEIKYNSKKSILSMFNLSNNSQTRKIVDNGFTLKYQNCGVYEIWIQGIEKNTFNWVKIKLIDSPF